MSEPPPTSDPPPATRDPRTGATLAYGSREQPAGGDLGATVVDSAALGATLAAGAAPAAAMPTQLGASRAAVLPRIELRSGSPQVFVEEKQRYQSERVLGEGGLGVVVGALDNDIGRRVAVKRLRGEARSPANLARFVEEIRTVGGLEHPNIVPIHDVGVDERGEYFFVMKYVDGETLESIIARLAAGDARYHQRYTFEHRVQIFVGILEAIAFAHERGIIHRDIKPANIMIGRHGEVQVMDWGIARRIGDGGRDAILARTGVPEAEESMRLRTTQMGDLIGTPAYMSPEQARGAEADVRSDVYSLCVLLHELLTLRHYLADKTTLPAMLAGVMHDPAPMASAVMNPHQPTVPMDLTWFLRKGLAKSPERRYQSVQEMLDRLERRAEGVIPIECHITFLKRATRGWTGLLDHHPFLLTAIMLAGLIGGVAMAVRGGR